jgi:hypothetical protein
VRVEKKLPRTKSTHKSIVDPARGASAHLPVDYVSVGFVPRELFVLCYNMRGDEEHSPEPQPLV